MKNYVDDCAPTNDAKFLLNGIALMENVSVGSVLNRVNKCRKNQYTLYDYMENIPLPLDLKQSLRQRFLHDKAQSDAVMLQCYQRSTQAMKTVIMWLLPMVFLLILFA
ncbi:MAG: hypothetical protein HOD01_12050 [Oceanospirillaceae bacterium]|jgi:hypothetical protein|nr:hypothetical protein [Oceanospirillaceae bacterium]MBT4444020.1 hypothetical protein [Oceanospirillaceae bacterium]MBT7329801.1 hypothetical protein [Oceanospirillaceae bacterium]